MLRDQSVEDARDKAELAEAEKHMLCVVTATALYSLDEIRRSHAVRRELSRLRAIVADRNTWLCQKCHNKNPANNVYCCGCDSARSDAKLESDGRG